MGNIAERYKSNPIGVDKTAHSDIHLSPCVRPLDVVKDIVGHTSTSVTRIYTHFTDDTRRKVLLALPRERKTQPNTTQNKVNESSSEELKRQLADSLGIDLDKLSKIIELMK